MKRCLCLLMVMLILAACSPSGPPEQAARTPTPESPSVGEVQPDRTTEPALEETEAPAEPEQSATEPAETAATEQAGATEEATETEVETTAPADTAATEEAGATVVDDLAVIDAAEPLPRDQTALVEQFEKTGDLPDVARTEPLDVKVGDVETFWVSDVIDDTNYQVEAELRYAGPIVLMYVDTSIEVEQEAIEQSARTFEEEIYPRDRELFGEERSPGIDGDPRLTILNTTVRGAGGYFSSADTVVKAVNRFSNEREMFVVSIDSYPLGTDAYAATLAHEFQHMIEWNMSRRSPSWFNEGMSALAEDLNGFTDHGTAMLYLEQPDIQLTGWSSDAAQTGEHYGTSQLFMRYFYDQYGGAAGIRELISSDAGNNPEEFARVAAGTRPEIESFADLYADWAVANVLNDPDLDGGRYAYDLLPGVARVNELEAGEVITTVSQFGVDYLGVVEGATEIEFDGDETVGLTGAQPEDGQYMWWSQRGDDSVSTLTREFDLSGVQQATLQFSTWYEIELNWDYAFVAVSEDEGESWTTLPGKTTTTEDPQDQNLGNGITGVSGAPGVEPEKGTRGQWIEEEMDLTPFAGKRILVRFMIVHDTAYNAQGLLIDNLRIPEIDYADDVETADGGWAAEGFVRTTGNLPQLWTLRLIRVKDRQPTVEPVVVDAEGRATIEIERGERGVLAVIGATPFTTEPGTYRYTTIAPGPSTYRYGEPSP